MILLRQVVEDQEIVSRCGQPRPPPSTPSGLSLVRSRESSPPVDPEEILITNTSTGERSAVPPEYGTQDSNNNAKAKKGKAAFRCAHILNFSELSDI